jgi:hypothetical protein
MGKYTEIELNNAGEITPGSAGFQYAITTLSEIKQGIVEQKFYEVSPGDYMPVSAGNGAWADEIIQNRSVDIAGDFTEGDIQGGGFGGRTAMVDTALSPNRVETQIWAKHVGWDVPEIARASRGNWDVVESKLKSLKKNWDLGMQQIAFLGHPVRTTIPGLLNQSDVTVNTTLITGTISAMNEGAFQTFVGTVLATYYANSNDTEMPDIFVIPTDDYLGLGQAASATYPNISKKDYLENMFKSITMKEGFKILPLSYAQSTRNSLGENRYVLYRNTPETLTFEIPFDFQMPEVNTADSFYWKQQAYGQYSGVLVNRPEEILYIDRQ